MERINLSTWRKQKSDILILPLDKIRDKNYLLPKKTDFRITGLFPNQQQQIKTEIFEKRKNGEAVSTLWVRSRTKYLCDNDKLANYDKTKHKFTENWCCKFLSRHGLSVRKKTNKKKSSVFSRLIIIDIILFIN